jgi:radical SAM protein with 4Fe4S-binding SPASM domain
MVGGRVDADLSGLENRRRDSSERQSCIQAHARLIVHWDGKTSGCCPSIANNLILGDATKDSLYTIFNGEPAKTLRKALLDKSAFNKEPCKSCSSFETFKGYKAPWES